MEATLKQLREDEKAFHSFTWYLPTAFGSKVISGIRSDWWVVTGRGLNQRSFSCTPDGSVYTSIEEADEAMKKETEVTEPELSAEEQEYWIDVRGTNIVSTFDQC